MVGSQHQFVSQYRLTGSSGQVEVAVVGEVDGRGLVGGCRVLELQLVVLGDRELDADIEVSGIALLAVTAVVAELDGRPIRATDRLGFPDHLVEPLEPAVQAVGSVVHGQLVVLAHSA